MKTTSTMTIEQAFALTRGPYNFTMALEMEASYQMLKPQVLGDWNRLEHMQLLFETLLPQGSFERFRAEMEAWKR